MALSLREAVFICQDSELRFRRPSWLDTSRAKVIGNVLKWEYGENFTVEVEDILANDYEIIRPDGTVAAMPEPPGPPSREPR